MKFILETQRPCQAGCGRKVDAVRVVDDPEKRYPGLRVSRHFARGETLRFCAGSLVAIEKEQR